MKRTDLRDTNESCIPCLKWYKKAWFSNTLLAITIFITLYNIVFLFYDQSFWSIFRVCNWVLNIFLWYLIFTRVRGHKGLKMFKDERKNNATI